MLEPGYRVDSKGEMDFRDFELSVKADMRRGPTEGEEETALSHETEESIRAFRWASMGWPHAL